MAGEGCIPETSASIWHLNREIHKKAFEALYLQEVVTENKGVLMLIDVNNYYCHLLHEFQGNTLDVTSTVQKLEQLKKYYGEKICIVRGNKRKGNILYVSSLSLDEAVQKLDIKGDDMETKVRDIALLLREEINRAERFPLPNNLKIEDIKRGEITVPELVRTFFQNLIGGTDVRRLESNLKKIRIKSRRRCCICCNCRIKEASEVFNAWDCIKKFDGQQGNYRNYEPSWTLCQLPHNRRG